MSSRPFHLEAVLFDFDGTLTSPDALDFTVLRAEIGCPADIYVLEYVYRLQDGARASALAVLDRFEARGAEVARPNEGAEEIVRTLHDLGLRLGVITRNGRRAVDVALQQFTRLSAADFEIIVTRDDEIAHKPAPDGILHAAAHMGIAPERILMVGDYHLDIEAGHAAGAVTVYLDDGARPARSGPATVAESTGNPHADFTIARLSELEAIVRLGLPLPAGKLPNDLLARHLASGWGNGYTSNDAASGGAVPLTASSAADVIIGAHVGEDVAALDVSATEVLVAHGDPITLAGDDLGRLAVTVNANDIATSGGEPRWLLTTILLPVGTTPSAALHLLGEIAASAAALGIVVVGGHTEVTSVVTRPLVSSTMLGTVRRAGLRDKRQVQRGDHLLLTKALAIEGTALLAGELSTRLSTSGMTDDEIGACRRLVNQISILPEARRAAGFAGVRALHDVTEGGLATAVAELAVACGREFTVHMDRIPILAPTRRLCAVLGADPLGLIASGSLLIVCDPSESAALGVDLAGAGIKATVIGEAGAASLPGAAAPEAGALGVGKVSRTDASAFGPAVHALLHGKAAVWPRFARDEVTRLL
ncbi:MAG: HAD-IA family hydrolase [Thermoleophilia bacterium]